MSGIKIALRADSGNYLGRCNGCIPGGAYPDSAFVHVTQDQLAGASWAWWDIRRLDDGKFALQSDSGRYLGRCDGCIPGGAYPDSAFVHVEPQHLAGSPWAQFAVQRLDNGKFAFQSADTGNYLARCHGCIPGGAYPDSATVHVEANVLASSPWAHWEIILPNGATASLADLVPAKVQAVSVPARQRWVDTGVDLKAGDALTIGATGRWTNGGNPVYYTDADGFKGILYDKATLTTANFVALIGKVGDQVFLVGSAYQGTSPGTGRLYLQINEVEDDVTFADNDEAMDVEIRH